MSKYVIIGVGMGAAGTYDGFCQITVLIGVGIRRHTGAGEVKGTVKLSP